MTDVNLLARNMMTKNLVTLSPEMEVFAAIDILLKKKISGAPVVKSTGEFVGIFSESSSMRVIINAAYENLPDAGLMPFVDIDPPVIGPDTDLLSICQTFLDQGTRRLPVLEEGRLLGQVSRRDVMRHVNQAAKGKCEAQLLYLSALLNEGRENITLRIAQ